MHKSLDFACPTQLGFFAKGIGGRIDDTNPAGRAAACGSPMGFFAKGIDGRIDDPNLGWKGRGLWVTSGNRTPFHIEGVDAPHSGAPGATPATYSSPLVVQFQLRPDPLAH